METTSFRVVDHGTDHQATNVLTINLCTLVPGLTNRQLPFHFQLSSTIFLFTSAVFAILRFDVSLRMIVICASVSPFILFVVMWILALPLTRLFLGPFQRLLGFDDYKHERIELFLKALKERPEFASVDVLCVQECYSCIFFSGGYPEKLLAGARALGFEYAAVPSRFPAWPATLAMNSGLVILSKKKICSSAGKSFGLSLEAGNVNRGALHALLEDGTNIFTCHIAPSASVAGDGLIARIFHPIVELSRERQIVEFANFIREHAKSGDPIIVAGDFNVNVRFPSGLTNPIVPSNVKHLIETMDSMCGLVEASGQVRSKTKSGKDFTAMQFCRPTFCYISPPERRLTSYGNGTLVQTCDDAVFSSGVDVLDLTEIELLISSNARPHPSLTHLSDHWALLAKFRRTSDNPDSVVSSIKRRRLLDSASNNKPTQPSR